MWTSLAFASAQYPISVTITNITPKSLSFDVAKTVSGLLTEINNAHYQNRYPKLSNFKIDERTKQSILMLWKTSPFRCTNSDIVESGIRYNGEYEIRNIPFLFTELDEDDRRHEISIVFSQTGQLTGFHLTLSQNEYKQFAKIQNEVQDLKQRQIILDYLEQFRVSYNIKDISFLKQVFSEDALILVGKVIKTQAIENGVAEDKIEYTRRTKEQYIKKLDQVFKMNKRVDVVFDNIEIERHPSIKDWYLIRVHQKWVSDRYSDTGEVVLIWNFSDSQNPQINVRVWQPDTNPFTKEKLQEKDKFTFDDYNINK